MPLSIIFASCFRCFLSFSSSSIFHFFHYFRHFHFSPLPPFFDYFRYFVLLLFDYAWYLLLMLLLRFWCSFFDARCSMMALFFCCWYAADDADYFSCYYCWCLRCCLMPHWCWCWLFSFSLMMALIRWLLRLMMPPFDAFTYFDADAWCALIYWCLIIFFFFIDILMLMLLIAADIACWWCWWLLWFIFILRHYYAFIFFWYFIITPFSLLSPLLRCFSIFSFSPFHYCFHFIISFLSFASLIIEYLLFSLILLIIDDIISLNKEISH